MIRTCLDKIPVAELSESKRNQLRYLQEIMEKNPSWSLYQSYSAAIHYSKGKNIKFADAEVERCLRIYASRK